MADEISENEQQSERMFSLYDLEYRADEDDAWYSVHVVLDAEAQTLTVNCSCSPEDYVVVFSASRFETEAQVEELVARFRPVSRQLQDHDCGALSIGTTVCASHGIGDDDLRFYDAVVEAVSRQPHSFAGGNEECLCTFVLFWKHGRCQGTTTAANIGSMCIVEANDEIDPRIFAFAKMAKRRIKSSNSISASGSVDSASKNASRASVKKKKKSSRNSPLEIKRKSLRIEDSGSVYNYNQLADQDKDMGPKCCTADDRCVLIVYNLEKDVTRSSIKNFIYKQTTYLTEAYVFPRRLSDPFARGAILTDCQKKIRIIYDFLDSPDHLIVSSRGRPWVVTDKALAGTFGVNIRELIPKALVKLDDNKFGRTEEELKVVRSGTESYRRAKQLKDLFVEFMNQESQLCKKLALEETRIYGR